jgi:hypothetical protein
MLGLAQACQHDPGYFTSPAIQMCDWWCEHLPVGDVSYWDFDAGKHEAQPLLDTSATAIAAASLLKMRHVAADRAGDYDRVGRRMVRPWSNAISALRGTRRGQQEYSATAATTGASASPSATSWSGAPTSCSRRC